MAKSKNFEQSITELEEIVGKLEKGELSLEESIDYFQRGVLLSKDCSKKLDEIEKKVTILIDNQDGELVEDSFIIDDITNRTQGKSDK